MSFLRKSHATYVIPMREADGPPYARAFAELRSEHPGWLRRVAQTSPSGNGAAPMELYRVVAP